MKICPSCHSQINNPDSFFCFNCGYKLLSTNEKEKDSTIEPNNDQFGEKNRVSSIADSEIPIPPIRESSLKIPSLNKKWNSFVIGLNGLAMLFFLFSLGMFIRVNSDSITSRLAPTFEISNIEIENVEDSFHLNTEVLKADYPSIVPQPVLVYVESSNLEVFLKNKLNENQINYLEESYEMSVDDLLIFMKPDFSYFKVNVEDWAIIARADGLGFFDRTYSDYQENKIVDAPIYTSRIGEFLVFTENESLITEMDNVFNKISLGLSNDAAFLRKKDSINGVPLFFLYTPSSEYLSTDLGNDLSLFNLDGVLEEVGSVEGYGFVIMKEIDGNSLKFLK